MGLKRTQSRGVNIIPVVARAAPGGVVGAAVVGGTAASARASWLSRRTFRPASPHADASRLLALARGAPGCGRPPGSPGGESRRSARGSASAAAGFFSWGYQRRKKPPGGGVRGYEGHPESCGAFFGKGARVARQGPAPFHWTRKAGTSQ